MPDPILCLWPSKVSAVSVNERKRYKGNFSHWAKWARIITSNDKFDTYQQQVEPFREPARKGYTKLPQDMRDWNLYFECLE